MYLNAQFPYTPQGQEALEQLIELEKKVFAGEITTSLRMSTMVAMSELLAMDYRNPGEYVFALLAWMTGARAAELLDLRWKDLVLLNETTQLYGLRIAQPERTPDHRIFPLPANLYKFLKLRYDECMLDALAGDRFDKQVVDNQYICGTGFTFTRKGTEDTAVQTLTEILKAAGVPQQTLDYMDLLVKYNGEPSVANDLHGPIYFMRRTFGTYGFAMGLTDGEISYLMDLPMDGTNCTVEDIHNLESWTRIQAKLSTHPCLQNTPRLILPQ